MRVGQVVVLRKAFSSYFLPAELLPGMTATVLTPVDFGYVDIDCQGKRWTISDRCTEKAMEFLLNGRWLPEDHADVIAAREAERMFLAELDAKKAAEGIVAASLRFKSTTMALWGSGKICHYICR